jgi:type IV pilus assembly protein PilB
MTDIEPQQDNVSLPGIAWKMVSRGLLKEPDAMEVMKNAMQENRSFYLQSIEQNSVQIVAATCLASEEFGIPIMDIDTINTETAPLQLVSEKVMEKYHVLPLYTRGQRLFLGIGDPGNTRAIDEIKFSTGLNVIPILVDPRKLARVLDNIIETDSDGSLNDIVDEGNLGDIDLTSEVDKLSDEEEDISLQIDTPIVRFVNKILQDAIRRSASDIHIEPYERSTRIRFRIDGVLHDAINPPLGLVHKIVARLKILSQLDIAERRMPQDGRMKLAFSRSRTIDFRVSTIPTLFGEKMVIRVLDTSSANLSINTIGMTDKQANAYRAAANQPHGMILVTGPTGSGKTVSLYSALNFLNTTERNISSVEDPVEIYVSGINQVAINLKAGLTFATALRAFLRQDPDVIMVGEIRDLETAEISIKAAQTGHMVLSTLHTNDAPSSLTRLANMGVAPFNIASSISIVIAQRLIRRLCESCREIKNYPAEALLQIGFKEEELDTLEIHEAVGCSGCTGGFRGRTGIFEVMPMTSSLSDIVMAGGSTVDIERQARIEGINSMRQSGLLKVKQGITTLEEVERVTTG